MPCPQPSLLHCANEMQTIRVPQRTYQCITVQARTGNGQPVDLYDLTPYCEGESSSSFEQSAVTVELILKETWTSAQDIIKKAGEVLDAATGMVRFQLTNEDLQYAGTFVANLIVRDIQKHDVHVTPFFLSIEPSMDALMGDLSPALTVAWIRMMVRDTCPEANYLIDELEYTDAEIMMAMRNPIDEWNEIPPDLGELYTPRTFPFRNHHAKAAIGELLQMAGLWYLRNHLSYSAAGVSVNDRDKAQAYLTLASTYKQAWLLFVKNKKIEANIAGGFATLLSSYSTLNAFMGYR